MDKTLQAQVLNRDGFKCRSCGFRETLMLHHIVYRSHGGPDTKENLVTLCAACHRGHHDGKLRIAVSDPERGADGFISFKRKDGWLPV